MMRGIVVGLVGLCAVCVFLLSKRASTPAAQQSADLRRWEDDGGHLPEADHNDVRQPLVTVEIHST